MNYPRPPGASSENPYRKEIGWGVSGGHLDGIKAVGDRLRGLRTDGTYRRYFTAFAVVYDAYTDIWREWDGIREAVGTVSA